MASPRTNVLEKNKIYTDAVTRQATTSTQTEYRILAFEEESVLDVSLPVWSIRRADSEEEFLLFGGEELKEATRLGTLRLGFPIEDALKTVDQISSQVMLVVTLMGGMGLAAFLWIIRRTIQRIRLLEEGTRKISRGEYGSKIPIQSSDELGNLAESFNRMSEELSLSHTQLENEVRARTKELESFVYTVSHDLKSPVVSMHGMASLFLEEYGKQIDAEGRHFIDRIVANATYMEDLILGLLALSRIGRNTEDLQKSDAQAAIQQAMELLREKIETSQVQIVLRPLPSFSFDQIQLIQIFQNLISNGIKFLGDQPHPRIEIGGRETGDIVEFYVKDNGIGIDPAYHEKVFGIFQRLKEVEIEGTGVGLAIVKKIVDLSGGKIWVESRKGEGATFFFQFPRTLDLEIGRA